MYHLHKVKHSTPTNTPQQQEPTDKDRYWDSICRWAVPAGVEVLVWLWFLGQGAVLAVFLDGDAWQSLWFRSGAVSGGERAPGGAMDAR